MVRFIGSDNMAQNREFFAAWLQKLPQWRQTTTPFLFLHTPDIAQAPELVNTLWHDLRSVLPEIGTAPSIPQQSSLFLKMPPIIDSAISHFKREFVW